MIDFRSLKPIQALAASVLLKKKRLMLILPRQEGKTELGVRCIRSILDRPETRTCLFLAKSKSAGNKAVREKFARLFEPDRFEVNTDHAYLKAHKTAICFQDSVDKDPDRIRGGTYHFIHWSEVAFSKLEHGVKLMDIYQKVVFPTLRVTKGYALLESTTNGSNGWRDMFENAADLGFSSLRVPLSRLVEMGLVPLSEYLEIKDQTHPDIFAQEYECEWVTFQGRVYHEFDEKTMVHDFPNPEPWQMVVEAIDWGFNPSATCVLFAYNKDGHTYIFDEHYALEELPERTAGAIKSRHEHYNIRRFSTSADHDLSRNEEMQRRGIVCNMANKVNILGNRLEIKELLWKKKLHIHPRCQNLIKDLKAAVWDPKKEGEIDYSQCTWGHFDAEAALRYLVRELSKFEAKEPEINPHIGTDDLSAIAWESTRRRRKQYDYDEG